MLLDQIEVFRRGARRASQDVGDHRANIADVPGPAEWKPLWDVADDQEPVELPRAYVIPVGDDQRSAADADRPGRAAALPRHRGRRPHRGRRGRRHDLPCGLLRRRPAPAAAGARQQRCSTSVRTSPTRCRRCTTSRPGATPRCGAPPSTGRRHDRRRPGRPDHPGDRARLDASVPASGYLTFDLAGVDDVQALNALLEDDVAVPLLDDGSVVVAPSDRGAVAAVSDEFDLPVTRATRPPTSTPSTTRRPRDSATSRSPTPAPRTTGCR